MEATCEVFATSQVRQLADAFALDVLEGLSGSPKSIPAKYLYDERGSRLFQQITELDEYYPTRCELEILRRWRGELGRMVGGQPLRVVELGAGDGTKTAILLEEFLGGGRPLCYVPVDICQESLAQLAEMLWGRFPRAALEVRAVVAEYFDALALLRQRDAERSFVLFLGSNIGNFDMRDARQFLRVLRFALSPGDWLLIGFDQKKPAELLQRAYNDAQGVTAEFNFNLLERINRELGGDFDRGKFLHYGPYNVAAGRMESWLISTADQRVHVDALHRTFALRAWEGIHVESSYKYDPAQIDELARSTGYAVRRNFFDARRYFVDSLWQVVD